MQRKNFEKNPWLPVLVSFLLCQAATASHSSQQDPATANAGIAGSDTDAPNAQASAPVTGDARGAGGVPWVNVSLLESLMRQEAEGGGVLGGGAGGRPRDLLAAYQGVSDEELERMAAAAASAVAWAHREEAERTAVFLARREIRRTQQSLQEAREALATREAELQVSGPPSTMVEEQSTKERVRACSAPTSAVPGGFLQGCRWPWQERTGGEEKSRIRRSAWKQGAAHTPFLCSIPPVAPTVYHCFPLPAVGVDK